MVELCVCVTLLAMAFDKNPDRRAITPLRITVFVMLFVTTIVAIFSCMRG